jgi:hypothetical protein
MANWLKRNKPNEEIMAGDIKSTMSGAEIARLNHDIEGKTKLSERYKSLIDRWERCKAETLKEIAARSANPLKYEGEDLWYQDLEKICLGCRDTEQELKCLLISVQAARSMTIGLDWSCFLIISRIELLVSTNQAWVKG